MAARSKPSSRQSSHRDFCWFYFFFFFFISIVLPVVVCWASDDEPLARKKETPEVEIIPEVVPNTARAAAMRLAESRTLHSASAARLGWLGDVPNHSTCLPTATATATVTAMSQFDHAIQSAVCAQLKPRRFQFDFHFHFHFHFHFSQSLTS